MDWAEEMDKAMKKAEERFRKQLEWLEGMSAGACEPYTIDKAKIRQWIDEAMDIIDERFGDVKTFDIETLPKEGPYRGMTINKGVSIENGKKTLHYSVEINDVHDGRRKSLTGVYNETRGVFDVTIRNGAEVRKEVPKEKFEGLLHHYDTEGFSAFNEL